MNKTVVGIFKNYADAQLVVTELLKEGVLRSDISIVTNATTTDLGGGGHDLKRLKLSDGAEVLANGALGDAMTSTTSETELAKFGISTAVSHSYRESIRSGKVLVAVQVREERVTAVSTLMNRYCITDFESKSGASVDVTVPVVQEELQVGKREVQRGGVHVVTHVTEQPVEEKIRLREEHVTVQRHAVDRPVTAADTAFKEATFEVRQHAEVAVVSKEARVVEEVVIGKKVTEHTETVRDTVRRTDVVVEELPNKERHDRYTKHEADFRNYHSTALSKHGVTYDEVVPAYRFGLGLTESETYRGKTWNTVESDAKIHWEKQNPGTWERFKDAVRYAWERVQAAVS